MISQFVPFTHFFGKIIFHFIIFGPNFYLAIVVSIIFNRKYTWYYKSF